MNNEKATLYGVKVEFKDYERVKAIADRLYPYVKAGSDVDERVREKLVRIALKAVAEARNL